jgi:hypothetical protein
LNVVAGHFLVAADGAAAALAQVAFAAGNDGGHDYRLAEPTLGAAAGGDDAAADLVAERKRQNVIGAHAVVKIAEVGVADAAAGDLDHHLRGLRRERVERGFEHRRFRRRHHPAVCDYTHAFRSN